MKNKQVLIHKDENLSVIAYDLLIKDGFEYYLNVTISETFEENDYFNYSEDDIENLFDDLYMAYSENIVEHLEKNFSAEKSDYEDESLLIPSYEFYEINKEKIVKECFEYFVEEFKERVEELFLLNIEKIWRKTVEDLDNEEILVEIPNEDLLKIRAKRMKKINEDLLKIRILTAKINAKSVVYEEDGNIYDCETLEKLPKNFKYKSF